ncbi:integrase, partial [Streptococcus pneumoniae]
MKIAEIKKQNGSIVYRSRVYLGTDLSTGKRIQA